MQTTGGDYLFIYFYISFAEASRHVHDGPGRDGALPEDQRVHFGARPEDGGQHPYYL